MTRPLRIAEPASRELSEAVRWYNAQRTGLGSELLAAIEGVLSDVAEHPLQGSPVPGVARDRLRRMLVRRFPYQVVYEVNPDQVVVIAVAHLKRRPGYWNYRR